MSALCDAIEEFIMNMFDEDEELIELQRNELAQQFRCAPSQINYVLATRFTVERGYAIESKRGNGGYVRIFKLDFDNKEDIADIIINGIGESIGQKEALYFVERLFESGVLTARERRIMEAALTDKTLDAPRHERDVIRGSILKAMLIATLNG